MPLIVAPSGGPDFSTLLADFFDGGFQHYNDDGAGLSRAKRWMNAAYKRDVVSYALWPFREATEVGAAPFTINDLGPVATVIDTTRSVKLHPKDRRTLADAYPDLTTAGSPSYYYFENGVIRTYPAGGTLRVRYWSVPNDLVDDDDLPIVPPGYRELIVFGALWRAHMWSQNFEEATAFKQAQADGLAAMESDLLHAQYDEPELVLDSAGEF